MKRASQVLKESSHDYQAHLVMPEGLMLWDSVTAKYQFIIKINKGNTQAFYGFKEEGNLGLGNLAESLTAVAFCLDIRMAVVENKNVSYSINERELASSGLLNSPASKSRYAEILGVDFAVQGWVVTATTGLFALLLKLIDLRTGLIAASVYGASALQPILGMTVLESVKIDIDPRSQQLKRMPVVRLKKTFPKIQQKISTNHGFS